MKTRNSIPAKVFLVLIILLVVLSINVKAKSPGKFIKYYQVTDKEVIVESNKGVKILFTAFHNNSIGVTYFSKDEEVQLISPSSILVHTELSGSIYVEEIDELMQITTTTHDGLMIKVDKSKFGFTFFDKSTNSEIVLKEEFFAGLVSKVQPICFIVGSSELTNSLDHQKMLVTQ